MYSQSHCCLHQHQHRHRPHLGRRVCHFQQSLLLNDSFRKSDEMNDRPSSGNSSLSSLLRYQHQHHHQTWEKLLPDLVGDLFELNKTDKKLNNKRVIKCWRKLYFLHRNLSSRLPGLNLTCQYRAESWSDQQDHSQQAHLADNDWLHSHLQNLLCFQRNSRRRTFWTSEKQALTG